MKSRITTYILFFILLSSCNKSLEKNHQLFANEDMLRILDSFVRSNPCEDCLHEIYVDKRNPHGFSTIIYSGKQSLTKQENIDKKQNSLDFVKSSNGTSFDIYSGTERYFHRKPRQSLISDTVQYDNRETVIWIVNDSMGKLNVTKRDFAYPFMPLPRPEIDIKNFIKNGI